MKDREKTIVFYGYFSIPQVPIRQTPSRYPDTGMNLPDSFFLFRECGASILKVLEALGLKLHAEAV